jgi:hypothetical protein
MKMRIVVSGLAAWVALCVMLGTVSAQIFVTDFDFSRGTIHQGRVGKYTTSGEPINPDLITGLGFASGIAVSGDRLFVADSTFGTIGEYTTDGAPINPALISGLIAPTGIALSGDRLFVTSIGSIIGPANGTVGEYTTSGATVNPALITGLSHSFGIAVSGDKLFVSDLGGAVDAFTILEDTVNGAFTIDLSGYGPKGMAAAAGNLFVANYYGYTVGQYDAKTGATVNPALIDMGLFEPTDVAIAGGNLFVTNELTGTIGKYTMSGAIVDTELVSGLHFTQGIAVVSESVSVPDASSTWTLLLLGIAATFGLKPLLRRRA